MREIEVDPAIRDNPSLYELVEFANGVWEAETANSRLRDEVSVSWTWGHDEATDQRLLRLTVTDGSSRAETTFPPLSPPYHLGVFQRRISKLWGDFLQDRSHKLLASRTSNGTVDRHLDGSDALDRIIDSVADYTEREGHEPHSLRLPIRYATALMKLGPAFWGDFYGRIRESGLRAFDGQIMLGMKAELVFGVDAELQVA